MDHLENEPPELPPLGSPLRLLGERLTELLDDDKWNECEALLLDAYAGFARAAKLRSRPEPSDADLLALAHAHKYQGPPEADLRILAMMRAARQWRVA